MPDREKCWLYDGCPGKSAVCLTCEPDGNDCPIWRWFEKRLIIRCKDCKHWNEETAETDYVFGFRTAVCDLLNGIDTWGEFPEDCFRRSEDFFCADGERRDNDESHADMAQK